jgi:hypothetical protein
MPMMRSTNQFVTFLTALPVCLLLFGIIWQTYLPGHIYNCTDDNLIGFLTPGFWVHGNYVTVPEINPHDSMSKPDSIKEGWSVGKLWLLWLSFVAASVVVSRLMAFIVGCLFKDGRTL